MRVRDFTNRVADTFAAMAKSKGIALRVHVQPDVPDAILLDDLRMQQVLGNLLGPQPPPTLLMPLVQGHGHGPS